MLKRDVAIVLLSCFALFLFVQREGSFSFRKAWYHVTSDDQKLMLIDEVDKLPKPIVVDLNGDGHIEVIVATPELKLQVVQPAPYGRFGEGFAQAEVVAEVSLLADRVTMTRERWPVAMAAGYLDPEPREKVRPPRKQVLLVVTASWQLLAFDHNLKLMWEQPLDEGMPPHASVRELVVSVLSHQVNAGDRGIVVVGGSVRLGDMAAANRGAFAGSGLEGVMEQEVRWEQDAAAHAHSASAGTPLKGAADAAGGVDASRHFNYYAFEGGSGAPRWRHEASSFHKDLDEAADSVTPQHNFRLEASKLGGRHYGEMACREFRESVLHALPHRWLDAQDTGMEEAAFVKQRESAGAQKRRLAPQAAAAAGSQGRASYSAHQRARQAAAQTGSPFSWSHLFGRSALGSAGSTRGSGSAAAAQAGMLHRHAHMAHNLTSNALVAHVEEGLEAVHLFTGRTLCQLHLPPGALHADINGDSVIEHVSVSSGAASPAALSAVSSAGHHALRACQAVVTSGIPPRDVLWAVNVCPEHHGLASIGNWPAGGEDGEGNLGVQVLPPVMLPIARADGSYSHLRGQNGMLLFLNDRGFLVAHKSDGSLLWERYLALPWRTEEEDAEHAALMPFSLWRDATPTAVLASGADRSLLVSEHGHVLAGLNHPFTPVLAPVVADFNGDGLNDVILVTAAGIFGYAQVVHYGGLQMAALLLTLIAAMGVVWWTNQYEPGGAKQRMLRSTEYAD